MSCSLQTQHLTSSSTRALAHSVFIESRTLATCTIRPNMEKTNTNMMRVTKAENHNKSDSCSSVKGELVLVQFCELLIYRSSFSV